MGAKDIFKSNEKFLHAKMPIGFYKESGEKVNGFSSANVQSSSTEPNFISNPKVNSIPKTAYVQEVIHEDPSEFTKNKEHPKTSMPETNTGPSNEEIQNEI